MIMADVLKATQIAAKPLDMVNNLWEMTFLFDDDPANPRKFIMRSTLVFRSEEIRRFYVTLKKIEL